MDSSGTFSRRTFLVAAAAAGGASATGAYPPAQVSASRQVVVRAEAEGVVRVETGTLTAVLEKGFLTSLKSKASGEEHIEPSDRTRSDALQLIYRQREVVDVGEQRFGRVESRQVNDRRVLVVFHNWNGDGVVDISADPDNGDLIIEPSAFSSRPGVRACRWLLKGLKRDAKLTVERFPVRPADPLVRLLPPRREGRRRRTACQSSRGKRRYAHDHRQVGR